MPANNHIGLALSRSKHSTYAFNPDGLPVILPVWQALTYSVIDSLYFADVISYDSYLVYLFLADEAFYSCVVESFADQGGFFAGTRIDVGEPDHPINGAGFIQDSASGILQKLTVPLWG